MAAYAFRSVGAIDYNLLASDPLTPGAPAGKATGDLLILPTVQRAGTQSITSLAPNWEQLYALSGTNNCLEIWARIATGAAADTPTLQWSGTTADVAAWIEAYSGDVYTDLATIVAHSNEEIDASELSVLVLPGLTITTADTLVYALSMRRKSTLSDDATLLTVGGGLTKRLQHIEAGGAEMMLVSASMQQTTATNYDGTNVTRNGTDDANSTTGIVLSLKTLAAAGGTVNPLAGPFGRPLRGKL